MKKLFAIVLAIAAAAIAPGYVYITQNGQPVKWSGSVIPVVIKANNSMTLGDGLTRAGSIDATISDSLRGWNHYLATVKFSPSVVAAGAGGDV